MAANRKKGKKSQNSDQANSGNQNATSSVARAASDNANVENAAAGNTDSADVEVGASDEGSDSARSQPPVEAEPSDSEVLSDAELPSKVGRAPGDIAPAVLDINASAAKPATTDVNSPAPDAGNTAEASTATGKTGISADTTPSVSEPPDPAEASSASENAETGAAEASSIKSDVKLSSSMDTASISAPQAAPALPEMSASMKAENFARDEIRTLLVPVPPFNRLVSCTLAIFCWSILAFIILKTPAGVNAQGMYTIDLPDAGSYVFFFRGDTQDAYGWTIDGRFRNSLRIDMEPIEPHQTVTPQVTPIEKFKDLSGANFFSVAEFEVNQPGKYNLWIKWNNPDAKCRGKITYEKDPVETFFFKWALGIVGTIAFFYMLGIPMTTRKAQATLPDSTPPVVTK
ncbi:MAG: hypothetical protein SGJ27_13880 [Candidatus Melainabacteria bacterium]|nr:hypothetical protein [Candidatus Melainabacteria bacterium]